MIDVHDEGDLRIATLNRPDKANSLTSVMLEELGAVFEDCGGVRALILTGAGGRSLLCRCGSGAGP